MDALVGRVHADVADLGAALAGGQVVPVQAGRGLVAAGKVAGEVGGDVGVAAYVLTIVRRARNGTSTTFGLRPTQVDSGYSRDTAFASPVAATPSPAAEVRAMAAANRVIVLVLGISRLPCWWRR